MIYHPDKQKDSSKEEENTETFKKIKDAYKILNDKSLRSEYDKKIGVPKKFKSQFLNLQEKEKKKKVKMDLKDYDL